MIALLINGVEHALASSKTIGDMVAELGLPAATLLIEHNGEALHRTEWDERRLHPGDKIEILRVAAGG